MRDVVVIGGGPGGYAAAIRASQLGGAVTLVEADRLGGTCVNHGCIPSKVWHQAASLLKRLKEGADFGVAAELKGLDLKALKARKDGVAGDIRQGMEALLANNRVEVVKGRARLAGPGELVVEGQTLAAKKVILALGGRQAWPELPGLEDAAWGTSQLLDAEALPASVLVWGGEGMGVELASYLCLMGVKVHLACPERRLLPGEDSDLAQRLAQGVRELGVEVLAGHQLISAAPAAPAGQGFRVELKAGEQTKSLEVERVLVTRREPNLTGVEGLDLARNPDGGLKVDSRLATSLTGVYAIGDCTGGRMLSHAASAMGVVAAENAMGQAREFPFHLVPRAVWSLPEVGAVGLGEAEAEETGREVETGSFPYAINGLAMARGEVAGEVKVVCDAKLGELLGIHIVGGAATELVGEAALALQLECTVGELARGIRAHPTFAEAMVDAARQARGWALYLPRA